MAHFAKLDDNNIVLEVHLVSNAALDPNNEEQSGIAFLTEWSGGHDKWKQTSYNGSFRARYAAPGYYYDSILDAFIPSKCHDSAIFNQSLLTWTCDDASHAPLI